MPQLLIREKGNRDEEIREVDLELGELSIGRSLDCDLPLDNQTISRRHASLTSTSEGFVLNNLGSANGTWVNGNRITRHLLQHEDSICFGSAVAVFHEPPDPDATLQFDVKALLENAHKTAALRVADLQLDEPEPTRDLSASAGQNRPRHRLRQSRIRRPDLVPPHRAGRRPPRRSGSSLAPSRRRDSLRPSRPRSSLQLRSRDPRRPRARRASTSFSGRRRHRLRNTGQLPPPRRHRRQRLPSTRPTGDSLVSGFESWRGSWTRSFCRSSVSP